MTTSKNAAMRWRSGWLLALLLAQGGCDTENATISKPPEAGKTDLSRPFGGPAPEAKKRKSAVQGPEIFVPKNPKLQN
ncbi:hypothetical protein [Paludisphaera mucosa]|uniref:Lipoprotein n=1 Tax=Paludisphaera mucosa TaxID=3030827 RepID=A0ABT6F3V3_9BACT|nr:hypothetical protein [Paludisphaera mucosa]MDG3002257.1 hypothetical protein [Paludisphaera mucosa]